MPRRPKRAESLSPETAAEALRAVGDFRAALIRDVLGRLRPFCPAYGATLDVVDAIDGLAEALTGDRSHFHLKGSSPNRLPGD